jgi:hypothetical protein
MGAEMGVKMAQNMFGATEIDGIRLCKEIATDLVKGKSREEVLETPYSYTLEKFYWTKDEYVPKNDPHWKVIQITIFNATEEKKEEKEE